LTHRRQTAVLQLIPGTDSVFYKFNYVDFGAIQLICLLKTPTFAGTLLGGLDSTKINIVYLAEYAISSGYEVEKRIPFAGTSLGLRRHMGWIAPK
jgi:hypothetical protein